MALHSLLGPTQNGLLTLVAGSGDMNREGMEREEREAAITENPSGLGLVSCRQEELRSGSAQQEEACISQEREDSS